MIKFKKIVYKIVFAGICIRLLTPTAIPAEISAEKNMSLVFANSSKVRRKSVSQRMHCSDDKPLRVHHRVPIYDYSSRNSVLFSSQNKNSGNNKTGHLPFKKRVYHDSAGALKTTASDFKYIYTSPLRINKGYALWLGGIVTAGGLILAYDEQIYEAFKRNEDHKYYKPIRKTGETFEPLGLRVNFEKYYFGALVLGYLTRIEKLVEISSDFLESYYIATPGKVAGNIIAGRRRPREGDGSRRFKFNDGTSFPSGHSSNIVQMATVLSHHIDFLPFRVAAYGVATTVCLQRITSDSHWPSDVYFGALYGRIISYELLKRFDSRRMKITPMTFDNGLNTGFQMTFRF
ncbi:phosphatase PAP2 family protein [Candidatus Latescibacterota bacterium]